MYEGRTRDSLNVPSLSSPHDRYKIEKKLGSGIFGKVFQASDDQAAGKSVAAKVINLTDTKEQYIHDEYKILRDFTKHPNIIDFYGVFCERSEYVKKIWFVIEVSLSLQYEINYVIRIGYVVYLIRHNESLIPQLCEFGSVIDIVRKLKAADKKMSEEHIAYILKYTIKVSPIRMTINMSFVTYNSMAAYKTKALPVRPSTAESIGSYLECKLNCSRISAADCCP